MQREIASSDATAVRGPTIARSLVSTARLALTDLGRWDEVCERFARDNASTDLERVLAMQWVALDTYVALVEAAHAMLGDDATRQLGVARFSREAELDFLGTIIRSWKRSLGDDPSTMLQVASHLWRAGMTGSGRLVVERTGSCTAVIRFVDPPRQLLQSQPWQRLLEGMGEGILAVAGTKGTSRFTLPTAATELDLVVRWDSKPE